VRNVTLPHLPLFFPGPPPVPPNLDQPSVRIPTRYILLPKSWPSPNGVFVTQDVFPAPLFFCLRPLYSCGPRAIFFPKPLFGRVFFPPPFTPSGHDRCSVSSFFCPFLNLLSRVPPFQSPYASCLSNSFSFGQQRVQFFLLKLFLSTW